MKTEKKGAYLPNERRSRIAELVSQQGVVRVRDLSEMFQVSEVTIRSDLDLLTERGLIIRDHGGASANTEINAVIDYGHRASLNLDVKRRIGRVAAQMVVSGETIIMDAGTTIMEMARSLDNELDISVATNALNVAVQLGSLPNVRVSVLGGLLIWKSVSTVGFHAERDLDEIVVNTFFLGASAIDARFGVTDASAEVAGVKRKMIKAAQRVILVADSSKWGQVAFAKVVPLSDIDVIVTDSGLPSDAQALIRHMNVKLICV